MTSYSVIDKSARCPIVRGLIPQIVGALPPFVAQLLQDHPRLVLAGGAIRDILIGVEPQDYDLVVAWPALAYPQDQVAQLMERGRSGVCLLAADTESAADKPTDLAAWPTFITETDRAFTLHWHPIAGKRPPVQLLRRAFDSVPAALDSFDYSVTQAALYHYPGHTQGGVHPDTVEAGWYLQIGEQYLADLMVRRLRFVGGGLGTADASAVRGLKLMGRGQGWRLDSEDIGALAAARLRELDAPAAADQLRAGWTATSTTAGSGAHRPDQTPWRATMSRIRRTWSWALSRMIARR